MNPKATTEHHFANYREFWPHYLSVHSKPATRRWHTVGLLLAFAWFGAMTAMGRIWLAPLALIVGYGFAWYSNFFIEGNRPASFGHPFWSFISEFRMAYLVLTGKI